MKDNEKSSVRAVTVAERPAIGRVSLGMMITNLPALEPLDDEILVKVHAAALNLDDILLVQGTSVGRLGCRTPSPENPYVPGMDFSGEVLRTGNKTGRFTAGEKVFGIVFPGSRRGAWASETCVKEKNLFHKPEGTDFPEAAAFATSALAAYVAVKKADVREHDRCLVVGASGGIGSIIVQLLKSKGAFVTGVCSSSHAPYVRKTGADEVVDYTSVSFARAVRASKERFVDKVFDCIGGKDTECDAFSVLKKDGVFVTLVGPEKFIGRRKLSLPRFAGMLLYMFGRSLVSRIKGPRYEIVSTPVSAVPEAIAYFMKHNLRIPVDRTVPLKEQAVRDALDRVYSRHARGKTIITFS